MYNKMLLGASIVMARRGGLLSEKKNTSYVLLQILVIVQSSAVVSAVSLIVYCNSTKNASVSCLDTCTAIVKNKSTSRSRERERDSHYELICQE